jgi:peptidoglycan-associated lipoprotein
MSLVCVLAGIAITACGAEKKNAEAPSPPTLTSAPIKPVSPTVAVSDDLAKACNLQLDNTASAPKFNFDNSELQPADQAVLGKIAECLTTGPLKGKSLKLVGRADPRGEGQYNMALGAQRATGVGEYLAHLGLDKSRVNVTSRGELDASGTDEGGWQTDRRVDITLAQ